MGNARKNTFPDRKDSTVQDVTGSPKSAGKILKELGSVFFRTLATMFFVMVIMSSDCPWPLKTPWTSGAASRAAGR